MSSEPFLSRHEMPCNPILIKIPLCFSGTNQPVQLSPHCTGLIIKQSKAPILFLLHVAGTGHCSAGEQCAVPPAGGKAAEWQEDDFFLHCCFCFSNIYRSRVNLSSHLWVGGSLPWKASSLPPSLSWCLVFAQDSSLLQHLSQTPSWEGETDSVVFTAPLPCTSVSIAFWLCTGIGAKIHHKNTILFQVVTAQTGIVCIIWCMEVFHVWCFLIYAHFIDSSWFPDWLLFHIAQQK